MEKEQKRSQRLAFSQLTESIGDIIKCAENLADAAKKAYFNCERIKEIDREIDRV